MNNQYNTKEAELWVDVQVQTALDIAGDGSELVYFTYDVHGVNYLVAAFINEKNGNSYEVSFVESDKYKFFNSDDNIKSDAQVKDMSKAIKLCIAVINRVQPRIVTFGDRKTNYELIMKRKSKR